MGKAVGYVIGTHVALRFIIYLFIYYLKNSTIVVALNFAAH